MVGSYSVTWITTEILSILLFMLCLLHALKSDDAKFRTMTLFCFVIAAAIFEHVGVFVTEWYSYDQHRLMMFGAVPLSTLLIESSILYAGTRLFEQMDLPCWMAIWSVGLWSAFADASLDPVFVHDYQAGSGQWNWNDRYDLSFFGIPFDNFSGWLFMTGVYAFLTLLLRKRLDREKHPVLEDWYPLLVALVLVVPIAVFTPLICPPIPNKSRLVHGIADLTVLAANCIAGTVFFVKGWKQMRPVDWKKDSVIWLVPVCLDVFDLIVAFAKGIAIAYLPAAGVFAVHLFFFWRLKTQKSLPAAEALPKIE